MPEGPHLEAMNAKPPSGERARRERRGRRELRSRSQTFVPDWKQWRKEIEPSPGSIRDLEEADVTCRSLGPRHDKGLLYTELQMLCSY